MDLLVAFAGYSKNRRQEAFESALTANKIPWLYHQMSDWSFRLRMNWQQSVAASHPKAAIAFTDACDYIYLGGSPEELAERILGCGRVSFPAQRECWPVPEWESAYPPSRTPWRFLNAPGPAGLGSDIADAISTCRTRYPLNDIPGDLHGIDEWAWQQMHMDGLVSVDTTCELTQCLYGTPEGQLEMVDGKLVNLITLSRPMLVHGNGSSLNHAHHRRMFGDA